MMRSVLVLFILSIVALIAAAIFYKKGEESFFIAQEERERSRLGMYFEDSMHDWFLNLKKDEVIMIKCVKEKKVNDFSKREIVTYCSKVERIKKEETNEN